MSLLRRRKDAGEAAAAVDAGVAVDLDGVVEIGSVVARSRVRVVGAVTVITSRPGHGIPALSAVLRDDTGAATLIWTGRRSIGGVSLGRRLLVEGVPSSRGGQLEFTNPSFTLLPH